MMFDTDFKYRIVSNEGHCSYADTLKFAKLYAGEMILSSLTELQVELVRQQGRPRRWQCALTDDCGVKLSELFCDSLDEPAADFEAKRAAAMATLIDREERRREQGREKRAKKNRRGLMREAVICISLDPPRRFRSVRSAARWIGVKRQTLQRALHPGRDGRQRNCVGMKFKLARQCSAEVQRVAVDHQEGEDVKQPEKFAENR